MTFVRTGNEVVVMTAAIARDIMKKNVISVPTTMDLRDLAKLFLEQGITGAPVVDESGNLAGVVSQTDLVYYNLTRDDELVMDSHFYQSARMEGRHIPTGFQIEDTNTGCVADVMTPVVHSVTEKTTVDAIVRLMTRKHIHRVIVRSGRRAVGVISALDVLRAQHAAMRSKPTNGTGKPARSGNKKKAVRAVARAGRRRR
jgi:CBS domain-containing protein